MGLRAVDVLLSGAAQLAFEDLQRGTDKVSASIVRKIRRFKDILLADCQCGEVVRKSSIPKALKKKHGLENLSVCDLPSAWRLLYTIVRVGDKPYITIVEIVDHDAYDKWFPSDRQRSPLFQSHCLARSKATRKNVAAFSQSILFSADDPFNIFHLHGSVSMVKLEDGRVVHMLAFQPGRKYTVDGEQIEGEVMIYPVLEKQLARYPFSGILATFHERIADAMMVVIVGFQLRDEPVLRTLKDAARSGQKVLLIRKNSKADLEKFSSGLRGRAIAIPMRLGDPGIEAAIVGKRDE